MIILDLNQTILSNLMIQANNVNFVIEENLLKHMVLNSIRSYRNMFCEKYGDDLIIACEGKKYWRKSIFPYYKANRKKVRDASKLNWSDIFKYIDNIKNDLAEFFPYKVLEIETSEADDIIATLVQEFHKVANILIISSDKDFIQLQKYSNVNQYDPIRKKFLTHENPILFLKEHIFKGDSGDGIPNVLSKDDCFVSDDKQVPMTKKRLDFLLGSDYSILDEKVRRNYDRNNMLINLELIPENLRSEILNKFNSIELDKFNKRRNLISYFAKNKMSLLIENITEF